jgi:hypothetical protein
LRPPKVLIVQENVKAVPKSCVICPTGKAKVAHARHAQIARRANLPQACSIAETPKSGR